MFGHAAQSVNGMLGVSAAFALISSIWPIVELKTRTAQQQEMPSLFIHGLLPIEVEVSESLSQPTVTNPSALEALAPRQSDQHTTKNTRALEFVQELLILPARIAVSGLLDLKSSLVLLHGHEEQFVGHIDG